MLVRADDFGLAKRAPEAEHHQIPAHKKGSRALSIQAQALLRAGVMKLLSVLGLSLIWLVACGKTEADDAAAAAQVPVTSSTGGTTGHTTANSDTATTGSVNPPDCPSTEPVIGTECGPVGLECNYNDCSFPDFLPPYQATCVDGRWEWTMMGECDVPECPNQAVLIDLPCDGSLYTGPCPTYDGCQNATPVWCTESVWKRAADAATASTSSTTGIFGGPACPDWPQTVGSLCCPAWHAQNCSYTAFSNTIGVAATGGPGFTPPAGPVTPCVSCMPDGVWRESTGCE